MFVDIKEMYFNWMIDKIFTDQSIVNRYSIILMELNSIPFEWSLNMDENRQKDAQDLRYLFGDECGYPEYVICQEIDIVPPTLLEVIVALINRVQENILYDPERASLNQEIFMDIMNSLGLDKLNPDLSNGGIRDFLSIIYRFYNRDYSYNGEGGLFAVKSPKADMRDTELWFQFMWYLDEKLGGKYL